MGGGGEEMGEGEERGYSWTSRVFGGVNSASIIQCLWWLSRKRREGRRDEKQKGEGKREIGEKKRGVKVGLAYVIPFSKPLKAKVQRRLN